MPYILSAPGSILGRQLDFSTRAIAMEWRVGDRSDYAITFEPLSHERRSWRSREDSRFISGEYINLPWKRSTDDMYERIEAVGVDLFAHLSLKFPGQIAFTLNEEHGYNDRQTVIRPGKFLQRFYPGMLTVNQRDEFIANVTTRTTLPKVLIARSPADIRTIYNSIPTDGLTSCMQRKLTPMYDWQGDLDRDTMPCHPCEVYGDSDLGVAYLGPIADIIARCVVWPDRQLYSRCYGLHGHDMELSAVLESLGYRKGSMDGATVRHLTDGNDRIVMPYIDGVDNATVISSTHITLGSGELGCQQTDGWAKVEDEEGECSHCGSSTDNDELNDHGGMCASCDEDTVTCDECGTRMSNDDANSTNDGYLCGDCYRDASTLCAIEGCRNRWIESDLNRRTRQDRSNRSVTAICEDCGDEHDYCRSCDEYYSQSEGDCPDCREDEEEEEDSTDEDSTPELVLTSTPVDWVETLTQPHTAECIDANANRAIVTCECGIGGAL